MPPHAHLHSLLRRHLLGLKAGVANVKALVHEGLECVEVKVIKGAAVEGERGLDRAKI